VPTPDAGRRASTLVLQIGGERRAIAARHVLEVLRDPPLARVPGAVPAVAGLVNHRGRILTVGDTVRALGLSAAPVPGRDIVVVEWQNHRFGLVVDGVVELAGDARTGLADIDLELIATAIFA
jgi:purine-binding chemotaxis protein CheW